jgi:hypothetical protein
MERLPYIDDHAQVIASSPERVWTALLSMLRGQLGDGVPQPLAAAWGLQYRTRSGDWNTSVSVGDTLPGFAVAEVDPLRLLALRGRHRFSRYELRFELDSQRPGSMEVRARTSAVFPGPHGQMYRALVIGTGGHRIAVRRMLSSIARRVAPDPYSQ